MRRQIVLVVDHYIPTPERDAGSATMMAFLDVLARADLVVKFWPHNQAYSLGYTERLQGMGIEVFPRAHVVRKLDQGLRPRTGPCAAQPPRRGRGRAAADPPPLRAHVVYYGHDLHFRRMRQQAEVTHDDRLRRAADAMLQRERLIWRQADLSLYPSEEEAAIAAELQTGRGDCLGPAVRL